MKQQNSKPDFLSLKSMEGVLSLAQDSLSLTYDNLVHNDGFWTEPPVGFSRILDADADKVLFGEPYSNYEPQLMRYLQTLSIQEMDNVFGEPLEIVELPGYDDAEETEKIVARSYAANTRIVLHYSDWPNEVFRVVSGATSNPQIVFLRGIKIGDSLSSGLSTVIRTNFIRSVICAVPELNNSASHEF